MVSRRLDARLCKPLTDEIEQVGGVIGLLRTGPVGHRESKPTARGAVSIN